MIDTNVQGNITKDELISCRDDFPFFASNHDIVYLDSAATALKPQCVIDAMSQYYSEYSSNVHRGLYDVSEKATHAYEGARETVRSFIGAASTREIIFTRGTTESINLVAQSWGRAHLKIGDEIILTIAEHHSNIVPWQMLAKEKKCAVKFIDIDERGALKTGQFSKLLTRKTRLIALSHVANALGTIAPLRPIIQKAHAISAKVLIDAAQSAPHMPIDVGYLDCDFLAFSGHKMCGPTGIGVLYAKEKILSNMPPLFGGGDMIREVHKTHATWNDLPWKFEAGTPHIAGAIGLAAAIKYLESIGLHNIRRHEERLLSYSLEALKKIDGVTLYGPCDPPERSSVISFNVDRVHPHDVAAILNEEHICIRAGHHCCMPLMERLKIPATARASFYLYTSELDIDRLCGALKKVKKIFS